MVFQVGPSMMAANMACLGDEIKALEKAGADFLHWDIMDGHYVPNLTFGPSVVKALRKKTPLPFDVHLMVTHPEHWLDAFMDAGANAITLHAETPHIHRLLKKIRDNKIKAGVALNPATTLETLSWVQHALDFVLFMAVDPGFGGQSYMPHTEEKIRVMQGKMPHMPLYVDGGVTQDKAKHLKSLGIQGVIMGSGFFSAIDYGKVLHDIRT